MTEKEIKDIIKIVIREVQTQKEELKKQEYDERFQDVKLLMKNYRKLKKHFENMDSQELKVDSLNRTSNKTHIMMTHVDKMLKVYEALCNQGDKIDQIRYQALHMRYVAEPKYTVADIANALNIDNSTFYRYVNTAFEDMAVLLFGIEALDSWKQQ